MTDLPNTDLANGRPLPAGTPFRTRLGLTAGPNGDPATGYLGTEAVAAVFAPGDGLPSAWAAEIAWESPFDPDDPGLDLSWGLGTTSGIDPGRYWCYLTVGDATQPVGLVDLIAGVDAEGEISPTPLISAAEFYSRVGGWAGSLQSSITTAGLKRTLSVATSDLYDLLADRHAAVYLSTSYYGERRSEYMTALLTPGKLTTTDAMRDYVAAMAVLRLVEFQPSARDTDGSIRRIIERAESRARMALSRIIAVVEGFPDPVRIGGQRRVVRG